MVGACNYLKLKLSSCSTIKHAVLFQGTPILYTYRISSNKRRASNKHQPLISAALLGIHIEINASL